MQVKRTNYQVNATPTFAALTEDEIEAIYQSALIVLSETGVRVQNPDGIELAHSSGAIVEGSSKGSSLVRLPSWIVDRALATVPGQVVLVGPDRVHQMQLQKNQVYFGTGAGTAYCLDPFTGERRSTTFDDVKNSARLAQALPNVAFFTTHGGVKDSVAGTHDRWHYLAALEGTNKPVNVTTADRNGVRDLLEMAHVRAGGKKEWQKAPTFSLCIEQGSSMSRPNDVVSMLLFASDNDVPIVFLPNSMADGRASGTLAATIVRALADNLFAIVLSQLRKPGLPFIIGGFPHRGHASAAAASQGGPETAILDAAFTDVAKWLGVPMVGRAGCSDAKLFDEQAALEATLNLSTAALAGGNMVHGVGYLEGGLTMSADLLVACDEIIDMVKRVLRGVPVTEGTMALDVIDRVGPGGHFLDQDHTYRRFRTEIWRPKVLDRQNWENWTQAGSKSYQERVRERVVEILGAETEPLMDEAMVNELRRICELAEN
jgi:trimethylamine--corrinoid protein Co-methyltransferase